MLSKITFETRRLNTWYSFKAWTDCRSLSITSTCYLIFPGTSLNMIARRAYKPIKRGFPQEYELPNPKWPQKYVQNVTTFFLDFLQIDGLAVWKKGYDTDIVNFLKFFRTTARISIKLETNQPWLKIIHVSINVGQCFFPSGGNIDRLEIHWQYLKKKMFLRRTMLPMGLFLIR